MIFDWPESLVPDNITVQPPRKTAGLNSSLSGSTQAVPVIRPPFGLVLEFGNLFGDDAIAYRALLSLFEGRANCVRIPLFDVCYRATDAQIGAGRVPHSDGTSFSDGALYATSDIAGVTVTGVQGQRTITVDFGQYAGLLQGGLYFGVGDHPYIAQQVWWTGSVAKIRCSPSLRTDYAAQPLKLKPTMIAGLNDDDGGELKLVSGCIGTPTLELTERFDGPLS